MGYSLRYVPRPSQLVSITNRTIQSRFLLKPNRGFREIVAGCLGRAQELYPVLVHGAVVMSNHYHLLLSVPDAYIQAAFMRHFGTNLSKEAGRFHAWRGPLFARRYTSIRVSEEPAEQIECLRYILAHGVKEHLVESPLEWPGLHCAQALIEGAALEGLWYDRTRQSAARRRGDDAALETFTTRYEIELVALPCWRHLPPELVRRHAREMVDEIVEREARERRRRRVRVLTVPGILLQHAHETPKKTQSRPAPRVHAATREVRRRMIEAYREFEAAFRRAADRLKLGDKNPPFPPGSFPPGLPFVFDSS